MRMSIGEKINRLCQSTTPKTLKKDLAEAVGVTPAYLSQVISGNENPSEELLIKIANFFNVEKEYLLSNEVYEIPLKQVPEVWNQIPDDLKNWILKKDSMPMLILAKMADENPTIPAIEIAKLIDAIRKEKDRNN